MRSADVAPSGDGTSCNPSKGALLSGRKFRHVAWCALNSAMEPRRTPQEGHPYWRSAHQNKGRPWYAKLSFWHEKKKKSNAKPLSILFLIQIKLVRWCLEPVNHYGSHLGCTNQFFFFFKPIEAPILCAKEPCTHCALIKQSGKVIPKCLLFPETKRKKGRDPDHLMCNRTRNWICIYQTCMYRTNTVIV